MAAGTAAVIVPIYINELAPPNYQSAFPRFWEFSWLPSILTIFTTEQDGQWRIILLARRELIKIRGAEDVEQELAGFLTQHAGEPEGTDGTEPVRESDPLLEHLNGKYAGNYSTSSVGDNDVSLEAGLNPEPANREVGLLRFLTKREYRAGFIVVAGLMLAQQLTGINAVVFYGVSILDELFPDSAKYLNAGISAVNLFVTLLTSLLFHGVSNMALLITSMITMGTSSAARAFTILFGFAILSAIATLLFVSAFSMGLGPVFPTVESVRLSVWTGRTTVHGRMPGTDGHLGVSPDHCPGRTTEPCWCFKMGNRRDAYW
ncbi:hypothetical protein HOY82DRAFT_640375 [Tuber indicum]|nr:hypothetical protein HOY82DRAFT_640375 [Tuber indicum]